MNRGEIAVIVSEMSRAAGTLGAASTPPYMVVAGQRAVLINCEYLAELADKMDLWAKTIAQEMLSDQE